MSEGGTLFSLSMPQAVNLPTMPLQEMFWGAYFGACTDRFGINWQFNYEMTRE